MIRVGGYSPLWVVPPPVQVVLGCIIEQAKQAIENKKVINASPWPLLQFQPPGFCSVVPQPIECDLRVGKMK